MCKFITVTPLLQGNGAKFVGTNLAHAIRSNDKDKKIALIDFDFDSPFLAKEILKNEKNASLKGMDNIYAKLHSGTLSKELFFDNMVSVNNIDILQGVNRFGLGNKYSHSDIQEILDIISDSYDFAIIVTGNNFSYASTVLSLYHSHELFVVVRENLSNEFAFKQQMEIIKSYIDDNKEVNIIYNYVTSNIHVEKLGNLINESNLNIVGQLEFDSSSVDNVDLVGKRKIFNMKSKNTDVFNNICKTFNMDGSANIKRGVN